MTTTGGAGGGLGWKQILFGTLAVGAASAVGYYCYNLYSCSYDQVKAQSSINHEDGDGEQLTAQKQSTKRRVKKKNIAASPKEAAPVNESASDPLYGSDLAKMLSLCNLPIEELVGLSLEEKQRIFYALLMKGEILLQQGQAGAQKSVSYFSKAVALVPNPNEVLEALKQALPPAIYGMLVQEIQKDIDAKKAKYFESITPVEGNIEFIKEGEDAKVWIPIAKVQVAENQILFEEEADLIMAMGSDECDYCGGYPGTADVNGGMSEELGQFPCQQCQGEAMYCSESCRAIAGPLYHMYTCAKPGTDESMLKSMHALRQYCEKAGSYMALFMVRYVSMLVTEEGRGNGAANMGPFAHFDHLPQAIRIPTEEDRVEAQLIRNLFSNNVNKDEDKPLLEGGVVDFMTDEIYAAMKVTLQRVLLNLDRANSTSAKGLERVGTSKATQLGLYHISSHIKHSCQPNVVIKLSTKEEKPHGDNSLRTIVVQATRSILPGEPLMTSYIHTENVERKVRLGREFAVSCDCKVCYQGDADEAEKIAGLVL